MNRIQLLEEAEVGLQLAKIFLAKKSAVFDFRLVEIKELNVAFRANSLVDTALAKVIAMETTKA